MRNLIFLLTVASLGGANSLAVNLMPFWKAKEKVYRRISEEQEIVVNAKTEDRPETPPHALILLGAAHVDAPLSVTYGFAKNFEELSKMTDHLEEIKFNPANNELFVHLVGLGRHSRMWMKLRFSEKPDVSVIYFEVIRGQFQGLSGEFRFEDIRRLKTEISMTAQYPFDTLGFPQTLVELGLEGMLKLMAFRMRKYVETKHRHSI